jgi:D-alanyl-D-alanine carboxypeptidase (penicillin-binding protein 5/6)
VLWAEDADRRVPIASVTKLMTALVALERSSPDTLVTVAPRASIVGESTVYLVTGEQLPLRDLLAAALIQSANDAAYAIAAHVGGGDVDRFVDLMNEKARELGMTNTHFVRPDGLDVAGHYSSARDVLTLARAAMRKPLIRRLVRQRSFELSGGRRVATWNDLLGVYPGTLGVKTGHTDAAGWSQVAAARRSGVTIYTVVLGSPSRGRRNDDLAALLDWGFAQYVRVALIGVDRVYARSSVPFRNVMVDLSAAEPAVGVVRVGRPLVETVVAPAMLELPVVAGRAYGEVCVRDGAKTLACRPLLAGAQVAELGLFQRIEWYADRALEHAGDLLGAVF